MYGPRQSDRQAATDTQAEARGGVLPPVRQVAHLVLQRRPGPDGQGDGPHRRCLGTSQAADRCRAGKRWAFAERPGQSLGVSRQTIHTWKTEPSRQERLDRACWLCASRVYCPRSFVLCGLLSPLPETGFPSGALCACAGMLLALQCVKKGETRCFNPYSQIRAHWSGEL